MADNKKYFVFFRPADDFENEYSALENQSFDTDVSPEEALSRILNKILSLVYPDQFYDLLSRYDFRIRNDPYDDPKGILLDHHWNRKDCRSFAHTLSHFISPLPEPIDDIEEVLKIAIGGINQ